MIKPILGMLKRAHEVVSDMRPVQDNLKAIQQTHEQIRDVRCANHPERRWVGAKNGKTFCEECFNA